MGGFYSYQPSGEAKNLLVEGLCHPNSRAVNA
jgi:hypothetical protein